jgi:hypothetical protein
VFCAKSQAIWSDPLDYETQELMEFHLVYAGNLLKSSKPGSLRVWEKHQIRRYLHFQLKRLWETHPLLKFYTQQSHVVDLGSVKTHQRHGHTQIDSLASTFEGYIPLVIKDFGMVCELEILFLRAEPAGNVLQRGGAGGGDIDNRMKTLFDALSVPQRGQVRLKAEDTPDPSPMYVLLEDDSLITSIKINADRFLAAAEGADPADAAEACVIIAVNVKAVNPTLLPYSVSV